MVDGRLPEGEGFVAGTVFDRLRPPSTVFDQRGLDVISIV
jgi:hypothetical protein